MLELRGTPRPHSLALLRSDSLIISSLILMKMVEIVIMNILMIQAWPKPINYWTFGTGEMIVANDKFVVEENELNGY